jgi:hypothetical protein
MDAINFVVSSNVVLFSKNVLGGFHWLFVEPKETATNGRWSHISQWE